MKAVALLVAAAALLLGGCTSADAGDDARMPVTAASTLILAAVMGTLWLGVAPLVNGLVAQIFVLRRLYQQR